MSKKWWHKVSEQGVLGGDAFDSELWLGHIGMPMRSGRYPWGSGENPYQRYGGFMSKVSEYRQQGLSNTDIARAMNMSTTDLRHRLSEADNAVRAFNTAEVIRFREKGMGWTAIAERMHLNESSVRTLYKNAEKVKLSSAQANADILKKELEEHPYLDVSAGVEHQLGITKTKLDNAVALLKEQGYTVETIRVDQASDPNKQTTIKVLAVPGTVQKDIWINKEHIEIPMNYFSEDGNTLTKIMPMKSVDSKRIDIRYAEDGGEDRDGCIELRRGVKDISLGDAQYAQVRIAVDGTHYLKGMAVYSDDLPDGIDIRFNTNKTKDVPVMGPKDNTVLKPLKTDPANPFGAAIKPEDKLIYAQRYYEDDKGERRLSCVNIVNEEGDWSKWSKTLASQFLAKQSPQLAKKQLDIKKSDVESDFNDILSVTNPTVKKKLLDDFARQCDANAEDLAAAALPRQASKVILPIPSLKDNEIYAPHLNDGETVALVRYPHASRSEIPILTVNNKNREGRDILGNAPKDAIGIPPSAAKQLSGADFDGDTALCIPCDNTKILAKKQFEGLKDFSTTDGRYAKYPGMHIMTKQEEGIQMGKVSNLITDMTIKGASDKEIERAMRHSMVVIDARKHELNYKLSEQLEGISELQKKYQKSGGGASTLLSKAGAEIDIPQRKEKAKRDMTPDELERWKNGEMIYEYTGRTKKSGRKQSDGTYKDVIVDKTTKVARMDTVRDARELIEGEGTRIEHIYADYANSMKALANKARAEMRQTKDIEYNPSSAKVYSTEVAQLKDALRIAQTNAPFERKAQIVAKKVAADRIREHGVTEAEKKRQIRAEELARARERFGAGKKVIKITDNQWKAIQAGAVHKSFLEQILMNCDMKIVRAATMPRNKTVMSDSMVRRARAMLDKDATLAEVAATLGVPVSTMTSSLGMYK